MLYVIVKDEKILLVNNYSIFHIPYSIFSMFGLIKLIKSLLNFVAEITAWVLLKFHLWVPAAFAVVFIMVCAVGGHSPAEHSDIFFGGLTLSIFASIVFLLVSAKFKGGRGRSRRPRKEKEPPSASKRYILEEHIPFERAPPPLPPAPPPPVTAGLSKYLAPPDENPMIFASRKDPDLLICEYSTRIEVYQRRGERVKLIDVIEKR